MTNLEKINQFTRRELSEEEVYLFDVILCDNNIDRDCEAFSEKALEQMQKLFIGKTGIFDHNLKSAGQTARIYDTELLTDPNRKTQDGRNFISLKAHAYMIRTESNADFIKEIDAGIKKEVSISCRAGKKICSVCGVRARLEPVVRAGYRPRERTLLHRNDARLGVRRIVDQLAAESVDVRAVRRAGIVDREGEAVCRGRVEPVREIVRRIGVLVHRDGDALRAVVVGIEPVRRDAPGADAARGALVESEFMPPPGLQVVETERPRTVAGEYGEITVEIEYSLRIRDICRDTGSVRPVVKV